MDPEPPWGCPEPGSRRGRHVWATGGIVLGTSSVRVLGDVGERWVWEAQ